MTTRPGRLWSMQGRARAAWRERGVGYALLSPAVLLLGGFLIYPLLYDLWLSVTLPGEEGAPGVLSLRHYRGLLASPIFWEAARNTLILVVLTALVELVVGVLTALLLWWRFWGRAFVFLSVFVPWAFPATFSAFAWYWLLMPPFPAFYTVDLQTVRWWLEGLFGMGAWQVLSIALMSVWRGSSIIAVFLLAGFNAIPDELLDVGKLEAPSAWRYFWAVVVPLSRRFLVLAALVALVITYIEYASMYIETGGRITVPMLGTLAYREAIQNANLGLGAALALIPVPFAVLIAVWCLGLLEDRPSRHGVREPTTVGPPPLRAAEPVELSVGWSRKGPALRRRGPNAETPPWRDRLRSLRRASLVGAGLVAALAVSVFHLFPVYYTAVQAFRPVSEYARGNPFWAYAPTLEDVREVVQNPVLWQWSRNTVVVFGGVLGIGLTVSILAGYALARFHLPGGRWLARLMFFSYFIPPTAVVIPAYQLFLYWHLDDRIVGIIGLYLTLAIPFATWLFYMYFDGLSDEVEAHALLDGGRVQVFLRVLLPMSWPVVIAAGLFALGMMGSDVLYGSTFSLSNSTKTLPAGLGLTAIELDEWASANAAILLAALPLIVLCGALSRYYVRGLRAALLEGA
jgi:ABC-type glycerol-3-phosphate transport system permease component